LIVKKLRNNYLFLGFFNARLAAWQLDIFATIAEMRKKYLSELWAAKTFMYFAKIVGNKLKKSW